MQKFLASEFGNDLGNKLSELQKRKLQILVGKITGKSNSQIKTLTKTILPRIALYKVLQEEFAEQEKAYAAVEKYMNTVVGPKLARQYSRLEFIPGCFNIFFRGIMAGVVSKSDNWVTEIVKNDKSSLEYNITGCLWYDACVENGCPELCKIFCDIDFIIYGSMKKVKFVRSGTLGTGSECCDFRYLNEKKRAKQEYART